MRKKHCLLPSSHERCDGVGDGRCLFCHEKVGRTFREKLDDEVDAIPLEIKQRILDALHNGKNVGEATELSGLPDTERRTLLVGEIIVRNIGSVQYLKKEAVK